MGAMPPWSSESRFLSVIRTPDEHSLVCETLLVPANIEQESGWACLKVEGILDFSLTGILAGVAAALAESAVSVFAVSTFNTDYMLVKRDKLETATAALRLAGYAIVQ